MVISHQLECIMEVVEPIDVFTEMVMEKYLIIFFTHCTCYSEPSSGIKDLSDGHFSFVWEELFFFLNKMLYDVESVWRIKFCSFSFCFCWI